MNAISIIQPHRPTPGLGWRRATWWQCPAPLAAAGYPIEAWEHPPSGLFALSAVEVDTPEPGEISVGPEYHLSVSLNGRRCTTSDAMWVLAQFDLAEAKEDNHVPSGRAHNFWRPVADPLADYECPCVDHEPAMREDKSDFIWRGVTR